MFESFILRLVTSTAILLILVKCVIAQTSSYSFNSSETEVSMCEESGYCPIEYDFEKTDQEQKPEQEPDQEKELNDLLGFDSEFDMIERSKIITATDGTILIEPVVEYELPELVKYFDKPIIEDYYYKRIYKMLYRCANHNKLKHLLTIDYVNGDDLVSVFRNKIAHFNLGIKQSELLNVHTLIEMKCKEFSSTGHKLSKEVIERELEIQNGEYFVCPSRGFNCICPPHENTNIFFDSMIRFSSPVCHINCACKRRIIHLLNDYK